MHFKRTVAELEQKAIKWWPKALEQQVASEGSLPLLLQSQEKFLSILKLAGKEPEQILGILQSAQLPANLFLKHLVTLADYGGEAIQRLGREFNQIFSFDEKSKRYYFNYYFKNQAHRFYFKQLPIKGLGNSKLGLDGIGLYQELALTPLFEDMIMLVLYGSTSENAHLAALEKCDIGGLLGNVDLIDRYVKEKYLHVSRITTGSNTNTLGQLAQSYIIYILRPLLPQDYQVIRNGHILLKGYSKNTGMPFDIVIENKGKKIGVEVSFQVTTNSVIERKSGQAKARQDLMHQEGYWIAYVLDGAGNFQRSAALATICAFSDCTVAYASAEIEVLAQFIKEKLG